MNYYENDIRHVKGDTYSCALIVEDFDQELYSVYFTCRDGQNDNSEILFEAGLGDGVSIVEYDAETNTRKYAIRVSPAKTKDLQVGTYYYDLQISVNYDVFTIMRGKFILEQDETKKTVPAEDPELYIKVALDAINGEVIGTTVTNKTDYLAETKGLIKTSINNFGGTLTADSTFRSYAGAIDTIRNKFKNQFDKNNANVIKLSATQNTVGGTGTFASSNTQTHVYIPCQPNGVYAVMKETTVNTVLGVYECEYVPNVNVGYTTLAYSSVNLYGTTLVKTSNTAQWLDVRITNNAITDEERQTILNSLQVYNITPIIRLNA